MCYLLKIASQHFDWLFEISRVNPKLSSVLDSSFHSYFVEHFIRVPERLWVILLVVVFNGTSHLLPISSNWNWVRHFITFPSAVDHLSLDKSVDEHFAYISLHMMMSHSFAPRYSRLKLLREHHKAAAASGPADTGGLHANLSALCVVATNRFAFPCVLCAWWQQFALRVSVRSI